MEGCGIQCENPVFTNVVVSLCYRYEDVEGCGIQCENPLFMEDEHETVHTAIAVSASVCAVCTLFTVVNYTVASIINFVLKCIVYRITKVKTVRIPLLLDCAWWNRHCCRKGDHYKSAVHCERWLHLPVNLEYFWGTFLICCVHVTISLQCRLTDLWSRYISYGSSWQILKDFHCLKIKKKISKARI